MAVAVSTLAKKLSVFSLLGITFMSLCKILCGEGWTPFVGHLLVLAKYARYIKRRLAFARSTFRCAAPSAEKLEQPAQRDCTGIVDSDNTTFDANSPSSSATSSFEDVQIDINFEPESPDLGPDSVSSPHFELDPVGFYKIRRSSRHSIFDLTTDTLRLPLKASKHEEPSAEIPVFAMPINIEKGEGTIRLRSMSISHDECGSWRAMVAEDAQERELELLRSKTTSADKRGSKILSAERRETRLLMRLDTPALREYTYDKEKRLRFMTTSPPTSSLRTLLECVCTHFKFTKLLELSGKEPNGKLVQRIIEVDRENILDSFCELTMPVRQLKRCIVSYKGEEGRDSGGLRTEFFTDLATAILRSAYANIKQGEVPPLLSLTLNNKNISVRHMTGKDEDDIAWEERLEQFCCLGRLLGLLIHLDIQVPLAREFHGTILKMLLDEPLGPRDIRQVDPEFFQNYVALLLSPGGVTEIEDLMCDKTYFMSWPSPTCHESIPLCEDGETKEVTEENKFEYIKLLLRQYLVGHIQEEVAEMQRGFWEIFSIDDIKQANITSQDLKYVLGGCVELDVIEWQKFAIYPEEGPTAEVARWFFEILRELEPEIAADTKAKVLNFVTGRLSVPQAGFAFLNPPFEIRVHCSCRNCHTPHECPKLPQAHTCFNYLDLPMYSSKELLEEKIMEAVYETEGFQII